MIPPNVNEALAAFLAGGIRAGGEAPLCGNCGAPLLEEARAGNGWRRWVCGTCELEFDQPPDPPLTCWAVGPCGTTCVGLSDHPEGAHTWESDDDIRVGLTPLGKGSVG